MESDRVETLDLVGGDPAVDFVNTLGGPIDGPWDDEWLTGYVDLVAWSRRAGLLAEQATATLLGRASPRGAARKAHRDAIALRAALYEVLAAVARGDAPPLPALTAVAAAHREALAHARLRAADGRLDWTWDDADLRLPLWLLAAAAVDLLRSERVSRLKQCGHCRWLFLDASKNSSRRWCSMAQCGTHAKVRRMRQRRDAAREGE